MPFEHSFDTILFLSFEELKFLVDQQREHQEREQQEREEQEQEQRRATSPEPNVVVQQEMQQDIDRTTVKVCCSLWTSHHSIDTKCSVIVNVLRLCHT